MKILLALISVIYPLLVYVCLSHGYAGGVALLVSALGAMKCFSLLQKQDTPLARSLIITLLVAGIILKVGTSIPSSSLFYPFVVSTILLGTFGASLLSPPTIIERIASASHGPLPAEGVVYCRNVCKVWTVFFAVNAVVSLDSTRRSLEWWSLYNGLISYILIGVVFTFEYLTRRRIMKRSSLAAAVVLGLVCSAPSLAFAAPGVELEQIRTNLKPPAPFRTTFTEQRFVSVLTAPLESRGELECVPTAGIVWRTTAPLRKTSLITPSGVTILSDSEGKRTISDRANISAALLSLMSGDLEQAQRDFTMTPSGTANDWTVTLTPKDTLVSEIVQKIVVSGQNRPVSIEVTHANQDRILTTFSAPVPLTPSELTKAQAILDEAS